MAYLRIAKRYGAITSDVCHSWESAIRLSQNLSDLGEEFSMGIIDSISNQLMLSDYQSLLNISDLIQEIKAYVNKPDLKFVGYFNASSEDYCREDITFSSTRFDTCNDFDIDNAPQ